MWRGSPNHVSFVEKKKKKKKKKKNLFSKLAYKISNKKSHNGWLPEKPSINMAIQAGGLKIQIIIT